MLVKYTQFVLERLRNENEDKTKTQMTQSFNEYSENETKIWRQNMTSLKAQLVWLLKKCSTFKCFLFSTEFLGLGLFTRYLTGSVNTVYHIMINVK